jgi:hypothetical protein
VLVQADTQGRLTLSTATPMAPHVNWEQDPSLEPAYNPMLVRIRILAECGLTPMMVPHDYVSKRIMPLKEHTCPAWLYTRVNNVTWLERCDGSALSEEALALMMGKLSPDPSSHDFVTPPMSCQPLCMDQATRLMLLVAMPSNSRGAISLEAYKSLGLAPRAARVAPPPVRPLAWERGRWCESSVAMTMFHCRGE